MSTRILGKQGSAPHAHGHLQASEFQNHNVVRLLSKPSRGTGIGFNQSTQVCGSWDSAVGIATGYRLDD
jgi:hypothetical protein